MEALRPLGWSTQVGILAIGLLLALGAPAHAQFEPIAEWGSATGGELIQPLDVERDDAGNSYVVDAGAAAVHKYDAANNHVLSWGSLGSGPGQFGIPVAIGLNEASGDVYVADLNEVSEQFTIQRFDSSGNFLGRFGSFGPAEGQFDGLVDGIAVNRGTGDVYTAEGERVQRFSATGQFELMWGKDVAPGGGTGPETCIAGCKQGVSGDAEGELAGAHGIATVGNSVFVGETQNRRVSRFNATTGAFEIMGGLDVDPGGAAIGEPCFVGCQAGAVGSGPGELNSPRGLDANLGTGRLFIVDQGNDRVQRWSTFGLVYQAEFGSAGAANGQFDVAEGLTENAGQVIVTDTGRHRAQSFNGGSGAFEASFGTPGPGTLVIPVGIGVGPSGIYVSDRFDRVLRFDPGGTLVDRFGSPGSDPGQLDRPTGVAADAAGNAYVADDGNDRVQSFDASGALLGAWGATGNGAGQFTSPADLAFGNGGSVYVVESGPNSRVQSFSPSGGFERSWGTAGEAPGQFANARGIGTDAKGNVYVADTANHRIQKFAPDGTLLTLWGETGTGDGQFIAPLDVAADGAGNVFVVDSQNHRIQRFSRSGEFRDRWGAGGGDGTIGDGPGEFFVPASIAVDADGYVYVVDALNGRVQQFAGSPKLALKGKRRQSLDRLKVKVRCKQGPCRGRLSGKVKVEAAPGAKARRVTPSLRGRAAKPRPLSIKLKRRKLSLAAGERATVKLKPRRAKRSVRQANALLEDGARATAIVRGVARNEAGKDKAKRRVRLRPAAAAPQSN